MNENDYSILLADLFNLTDNNGKHHILEDFVNEFGNDSFKKMNFANATCSALDDYIDVCVTTDISCIIIENKIKNAPDRPKQLENYIEAKKKSILLDKIRVAYIAGDEKTEPDEESWGKYYNTDIQTKRFVIVQKLNFQTWLKKLDAYNLNEELQKRINQAYGDLAADYVKK